MVCRGGRLNFNTFWYTHQTKFHIFIVFFFLQAILYDETRTQLDSRFLKKEETITAGESMKFDGHIVGIIELRDHKPLKDTNVDGRNCYKQNIMPSKNHNEHLAGLFIYSFCCIFLVNVIYLMSLLCKFRVQETWNKHVFHKDRSERSVLYIIWLLYGTFLLLKASTMVNLYNKQ